MSIRHLFEDCPDSYENLRKFKAVMLGTALPPMPTQQEQEPAEDEKEKTEGSRFYAATDKGDVDQVWADDIEHVSFYTADLGEVRKAVINNKNDTIMTSDKESFGSLLMDSGCLSNVAGLGWWSIYLNNLPPDMKMEVNVQPSNGKRFRLGGGEVLTSKKVVKFPGILVNRKTTFTSHIVDREIPMLW